MSHQDDPQTPNDRPPIWAMVLVGAIILFGVVGYWIR